MSTLAGAAFSFASSQAPVAARPDRNVGGTPGLSESIAAMGIVSDCVRLALYSRAVQEEFKRSLTNHLDVARLAGIMPFDDKQAVVLLARCRDRGSKVEAGDFDPQKLALVLGRFCHHAARRQIGTIISKLGANDPNDPSDCSIYLDVAVLREMTLSEKHAAQAAGEEAPFAEVDAADLHDLFLTMARRQLIRLHTFIPDREDVNGWVLRLAAWNEGNDALLRRYAEAYARPDAAKMRKFIHETKFYNREDDVIRLVRALHRGKLADPGELDSAVKNSGSQSQYAQALGRGFRHLKAASAFFEGSINEETLLEHLAA